MSRVRRIIEGWWDQYKNTEITPTMAEASKRLSAIIAPTSLRATAFTVLWHDLSKLSVDKDVSVCPFLKKALDGGWDPLFYAYLIGDGSAVDSLLARWYLSGSTPPSTLISAEFAKEVMREASSAPRAFSFYTDILAVNMDKGNSHVDYNQSRILTDILTSHASNGAPLVYDVEYPEITIMRKLHHSVDGVALKILFSKDPEEVACAMLEHPSGSLERSLAIQKLKTMEYAVPTL